MENLTINTSKLFIDKHKVLLLILLVIFFNILEIKNFETLIIIVIIILVFYFKDTILKKIKNLSVEKFTNNNYYDNYYDNLKINNNLEIREDINELNHLRQSVNNPSGNNIPGSKFINDISINNCENDKTNTNFNEEISRKNKVTNHLISNGKYDNQYTKKHLERIFYKVPDFNGNFNKNLHQLNPTKKQQFLEACNYNS